MSNFYISPNLGVSKCTVLRSLQGMWPLYLFKSTEYLSPFVLHLASRATPIELPRPNGTILVPTAKEMDQVIRLSIIRYSTIVASSSHTQSFYSGE